MSNRQKFGIDGRWVSTGVSLPEGGQAHVIVVVDSSGKRNGDYVLKRLKNTDRTPRLDKEIETTKRLHADGCPVLEIVDDYTTSDPNAARPWYVTPLVPHGALARHLERDCHYGGSFETAIGLYKQILAGVQSLHKFGIAHRDLKPDNILISENGAILADLGLSLALGEYEGERLTGELERIGSLHYTPPEGYSRRPIDQSQFGFDAYAMGKILYEVLAGKTLPGFVSPTDPDYDLTKRWSGPAYRAVNRVLRGLLNEDPSVRRAYLADLLGQIDELLALNSAAPTDVVPHWHKDLLTAGELLAQRVDVRAEPSIKQSAREEVQQLANEVLDVWKLSGVVSQLDHALGLARGGHLRVNQPVVGDGLRSELGGVHPTRKGLEPLEDGGFPMRPEAEAAVRLEVSSSDVNRISFRRHLLSVNVGISGDTVGIASCIVRQELGPRGTIDILPIELKIRVAKKNDLSLMSMVRKDAENIIAAFVEVLLAEVRIST